MMSYQQVVNTAITKVHIKYRTYERLQDIALIVHMWISSGDNLFERKFSTSEYFNRFRREIKREILKTRY